MVLETFLSVAGEVLKGTAAPARDTEGTASELENAAAVLAEASESQARTLGDYNRLVNAPLREAAKSEAGSAVQADETSTARKVATAVFNNVLGLAPLARTIFSLFGGGGEEEAAPLVKYAMPERLRFEAAMTSRGMTGLDYGQDGLPREYGGGYGSVPVNAAPESPQVTIQVQAMDSRSFLDHKDDIARAVREAMLNMHPVNDVVSEL
jgi:hypothetical protein